MRGFPGADAYILMSDFILPQRSNVFESLCVHLRGVKRYDQTTDASDESVRTEGAAYAQQYQSESTRESDPGAPGR